MKKELEQKLLLEGHSVLQIYKEPASNLLSIAFTFFNTDLIFKRINQTTVLSDE